MKPADTYASPINTSNNQTAKQCGDSADKETVTGKEQVDNTATPQLQAFCQVVESRRSVRRFTDTPISDEVLTECLRLAMLAPNSSNLQPWEFYVIDSRDARKTAVKNCMNQNAAKTAARLIAVVARTDNWHNHAKQILREYPEMPVPKKVKAYYNKVVTMDFIRGPVNVVSAAKWGVTQVVRKVKGPIKSPYYTFNDVKNWATNNTALAAGNLMLALRAHGFDSCAMGGFDEPAMKRLLKLGNDHHIVMMIGAGERADNGIYNEQFRFAQDQFVHYI
ncbi:nitroreductase family protein [Psychrobacter frigidicola]|uniref:Nitroreductase family protein n=1 Tax=Psychrobacter frigidicola TaxID=45611 RepID=A0A5C7ABQ9_9GAMM|nr:nitroreductase family protein [Psychrobacter frigidicola]TXD98283.1 nitroreductase family protein [Psychrobacter frigidicola]